MASFPISLFLVLFVQTTTGELSLPSLPEAVQLLQLETIRGLEQTILEKEDENRRLEEIIQSVKMEMLQSYNQLAEMIENMNSPRTFQLFCTGGVCSSRELPSCTESLEWEEEEVGFEK